MGDYITIKYENSNRKFEFDKETMILSIKDTYIVNKEDISQIIENINRLLNPDN